MGYKTKVLGSILFKAIGFFLAGILVSMALLADTDTLAWFSSRVVGNFEVQAASEEDIIEDFYTESDGEENVENPDTIVIKRAPGFTGKMTVYFSLENTDPDKDSAHGLRAYVLHINPAEIEENGENEVRVPLELKFNWRDLLYLLNDIDGKTTGILTLRYLNGFIIEQREISFDNWYLLCMGFDSLTSAKSGKTRDMKRIRTGNREQLEACMVDIMADIAGNIKWKEIASSGRAQKYGAGASVSETTSDAAFSGNNDESGTIEKPLITMSEATMARARIETLSNSFTRIELTKEQQSIIDIVAPGLRQYVDELYSFVEDLIARLNEKIAKIEELNLQIKDMNTRIQSLNTTIDELTQKYTALEQEKVSLAEEKLKLEEENQRLKDKIDDLKDEIDSFEIKNSSLNDEIENLKSSNNSLEEQIKKLEEENENLKKELENLKNSVTSGGESGDAAPGGSEGNGGGEPPEGQQPPVEDPPTGTQPLASGTPGTEPPSEGQQPPAGGVSGEQPSEGQVPPTETPPPTQGTPGAEQPPAEGQQPPVVPPVQPPPTEDQQPPQQDPAVPSAEQLPAGEPATPQPPPLEPGDAPSGGQPVAEEPEIPPASEQPSTGGPTGEDPAEVGTQPGGEDPAECK
ncbi:hypothetical protein D2962_16500 [Biomaibacter acetigenes]|uniref:Uncharacterized protein n=1 Tax=Biomaibacter acetigenes TaxID=2316383 RepID=A0A3G2R914_9FIRM|nr:hypothetical protein [Biomaibacter acetigenes]AYO31982.1 hypothetical protein D2962_16500 [Biomaibacter acetigenes]